MLKIRRMRLLFAAILILAAALPAHALPQTPDFSSGILDREEAVARADAITAGVYPDADYVEADSLSWYRYDTDGTYVQWVDTYVKILTDKGRREYASLSSWFSLPYNTTEITLCEIISPDGTVRTVDIAANSKVMVDRSQMGSNIYNPNDRILTLNVPGLEPGDTLHFVMRDDFVKTRVPNTWSEYFVLESTQPISRRQIIVAAPESLPLQNIALKGGDTEAVRSQTEKLDGTVVYSWTVEDVPQVITEPDMPSFHTVARRLLLSTIPDWQTISRWYWNLSLPQIEKTTPELKAKVRELTENTADDMDRVRRLFRWVSQQVRYLGITVEKEAPGYEPHAVSMTFERRAGVCRDKAALLVAMLREAGFEAFPVLIMNGPKKDPEVPNPFFNHAVTAVRLNGEYVLMDSTDETTSDIFPSYLGNQSYIVATPEGDPLLTSRTVPASENMMRVDTSADLLPGGGLKAESVLRFEGINDNIYRGFFSNVTPAQREDFFAKRIRQAVPGAILTGITILPENMRDISRPLEVRLAYRTDSHRIDGRSASLVPFPSLGGSFGMIQNLLGSLALEERRFPLVVPTTAGAEENITLRLNGRTGRNLALPDYRAMQIDGVEWNAAAKLSDDVITVHTHLAVDAPEFSPEEYRQLRELQQHVVTDSRKLAVFAPAPGEAVTAEAPEEIRNPFQPDAVVLDESLSYEIHDAHSWTQTREVALQVLTYAGKKRFSELSLDYNPAWENVELLHATVVAPDGTTTEIAPEEINLMDAGWAASAPRYPAGKTLAVGLPGVQVGSVIRYAVRRTLTDRPFFSLPLWNDGGSPIAPGSFQSSVAVNRKTLRIDAPEELTLNIRTEARGADIEETEQRENGRVVRTFTAENITAVRPEDSLPASFMFTPTVFVSAGDWTAYAAKVNTALESAAAPADSVRDKVREILAGTASDETAKAVAVRDFIDRNIRLSGPGLSEAPLAIVTPAEKTLASGYGNETDRAVLLHAMLKAAGLSPRFVLVASGPMTAKAEQILTEFPDTDFFSSVLVAAKVDGTVSYLNDTGQYDRFGVTQYERAPGLRADTGGMIRVMPEEKLLSRKSVRVEIDLDDDGGASVRIFDYQFGTAFGWMNRMFREMPSAKREQFHQEMIAAISPTATASGPFVVDFSAYPGIIAVEARDDRFAIRQGQYLQVAVPELVTLIGGFLTETRISPLYRGWFSDMTTEVIINLPERTEAVLISPPGNDTFRFGEGFVRVQTETAEGSITIGQNTRIPPLFLSPEDYPEAAAEAKRLAKPGNSIILLKIAE